MKERRNATPNKLHMQRIQHTRSELAVQRNLTTSIHVSAPSMHEMRCITKRWYHHHLEFVYFTGTYTVSAHFIDIFASHSLSSLIVANVLQENTRECAKCEQKRTEKNIWGKYEFEKKTPKCQMVKCVFVSINV